MRARVVSAFAMLPLLLVVYLGGRTLLAVCLAIGAVGLAEFFRAFEGKGIRPSRAVGFVFLCLLYLVNMFYPMAMARLGLTTEFDWRLYTLWAVALVAASFIYMFKSVGAGDGRLEDESAKAAREGSLERVAASAAGERGVEDGLATAAGTVYVGFFSFHVALADQLPDGMLKWLIFITAFGTDIMAFLVGVAFGRHKLCPGISPKKTVEGAAGGLFGSALLCGLFGFFFMPQSLIHCVIIGVLGGVAAQLGDLTASVFKRKLGIKDYGDLIPGHGGALDRIDSVLFTAPLVYYYAVFVMGKI